ncbi:MAG: TonB family protein [Acidobacteriota bacterium]
MTVRLSHLRFAFAALLAALGSASAQTNGAMTPSEIAAKATAVVSITGENLNGQPLLPGRGFLLGPNVVATDYAVVRDAAKLYAKTADGKRKEARILGVDARLAVAILSVADMKAAPLALGNSDAVAVGEAVYIIDSAVARQRVIGADMVINGKRYLKMPGQVSDDSRGCPVLNERGEVIAVTVADPTRRENSGFAVPASYLKRLGYLSVEGFGSEADRRREFRKTESAQEVRDSNLRPRYIRKSGSLLQRDAVRQVIPMYPPLAKAARVVGLVVIEITINENGDVISARAISGHQFLKEAALAAARGWKFRPVKTQGEPVRIIGNITFNFIS